MDVPPCPSLLNLPRKAPASAIWGTASRIERSSRGSVIVLETSPEAHCGDRVLVQASGDQPELGPGDIIEARGDLRRPRLARNPGDFDERGALASRGIAWILKASSVTARGDASWTYLPRRWGDRGRASIRSAFTRCCPADSVGVLAGIVLGDKASLDPDLRRALRDAGAAHLIVPSGTNVAFVLAFALWLAGLLGLPAVIRQVLPLALAMAYGLIVGTEPPYLRALLCAALAASARSLDLGYDSVQALAVSALILLLHEPRDLFLAGFQMSYLVVLSLVLAEPWRLFRGWPRPLRAILQLLAASLIAQLSLAPLTAGMNGRISAVGILANVILVPLSGMILGAGLAHWVVSLLPWPALFAASSVVVMILADLFRGIGLACAAWPAAALDLAPFAPMAAACYYLAFLSLLAWRTPKVAVSFLALALALGTVGALSRRLEPARLEVIALAGPLSGTAVARFPDGKVWLYYGGGSASSLLRALKRLGIEEVHRLILEDPKKAARRALPRLTSAFPAARIRPWRGTGAPDLRHGHVRFQFPPRALAFRFLSDGLAVEAASAMLK